MTGGAGVTGDAGSGGAGVAGPGDAAPAGRLYELLVEYDRALAHTDRLWTDLTDDELRWRPHEHASAIAWHLGHQPTVAHFLIRNLTAAEPRLDPALETLFDSATPEPDRGELPATETLRQLRRAAADRVRTRVAAIADAADDPGGGGAGHAVLVAEAVLTAIVNHEYQHDQWITEVRRDALGRGAPSPPTSPLLRTVDGYVVLSGGGA